MFLAPQQYSIPMSVPMKLLYGSDGQLDPEVAKLQTQIDQTPGDDLAKLDELRGKVTEKLEKIYKTHDKEIEDLVASIQEQISKQIAKDGVQ